MSGSESTGNNSETAWSKLFGKNADPIKSANIKTAVTLAAGAALGIACVTMLKPSKSEEKQEIKAVAEVTPKKHSQVLYVGDKCPFSAKVMILFSECNLLADTKIIHVTSKEKENLRIKTGKEHVTVPCLETEQGVIFDSDAIIEHVLSQNGLKETDLVVYPAFKENIFKDYLLMHEELSKLHLNRGPKKVRSACAWYKSLDKTGDGFVTLDEMLDGLDITRLLAANRRGFVVQDSKWNDAKEQVLLLIKENPNFAEGYRLKMILATVSDQYEMFFEATDTLLELIPTDPQALLLKGVYCRSLKRLDDYGDCVQRLKSTNTQVSQALLNMVADVDKFWEKQIMSSVPSGISEKMSILALGSPANDDGTPRPRLLGTLTRTLEAANAYPAADIFVTGAAVSTNMPEAIAMKNWLVERGIDSQRIIMEMKARDTVGNYVNIAPMLEERKVIKVMLVTVYYHLNRSSILADSIFKQMGLSVEIIAVAGESNLHNEALEKRMVIERAASYRDLARALELYESKDFVEQSVAKCKFI